MRAERFKYTVPQLRERLNSYRSLHEIPSGLYEIPDANREVLNIDGTILGDAIGTNSIELSRVRANSDKTVANIIANGMMQPILDMGCGEGYLVNAANKAGLTCIGIDMCLTEAAVARHGMFYDGRSDKKDTLIYDKGVELPIVWNPVLSNSWWKDATRGLEKYKFSAGTRELWDDRRDGFKEDIFGTVINEGVYHDGSLLGITDNRKASKQRSWETASAGFHKRDVSYYKTRRQFETHDFWTGKQTH